MHTQEELQAIADNAKKRELYHSVEFQVNEHMQRAADAYMELVNAKVHGRNLAETKDALKQFRAAVGDLHEYLVRELSGYEIKAADNINVNKHFEKWPGLDSHWMSCVHYARIFCFAQTTGDIIEGEEQVERVILRDFKLANLTTLAHIVADLVHVAGDARAESYYKEIAGW